MKVLQEHYSRKGFDYHLIDRNEKAAIYAQVRFNRIVAFEIFKIITSQDYKLNEVEIEGGEGLPGDTAFGVSAWSYGIFSDMDFALRKACNQFNYITNQKTDMEILDQQNEQVIQDAVRMMKSDFVALYAKQGYDPMKVSIAWHSIRVSPKAKAVREDLKRAGANAQILTTFADKEAIEEEVKDRKKKVKEVEEKVATKPLNEKVKEPKPKKEGGGAKGEKGRQIRSLIEQGITDIPTLMEKSGASKLYVSWVLKKGKEK